MAGDDITINEDEATTIMPCSEKVKFMCSHGGKILPRPTDNQMKYVGGETRIVAVHRDITYKEIMKKLAVLFEGDIVLKYQLASEDLESLVSVRSDEDLKYMFEEYHRQERGGISKLRAFLFPANPLVIDGSYASPVDPHALEQRYIDAINGIVRTNTPSKANTVSPKPPPIFTISSACSSPKSVSADQHMDMMSQDTISVHSYQTARGMNRMQKVHSSPNLFNLNNNSNNSGGGASYYMGGNQQQQQQQEQQQQQRQYHHLRQQHHHVRSPSLPPAPIQLPKVVGGMERSILALQQPVGRADAAAGRNSFSGYPTSRYLRAGGAGQHFDDTAF